MRKYLISTAIALLCSISAFAGVFSGESESVTFDVRLGCNFNTLYARLNSGKSGKTGSYRGGFSAGANVRFYPEEILAIETGLGIQQKGSKDMTIEGFNHGLQYTPWYLEMPLLASVRVIDFSEEHMGFLEAGVYGGVGVGGKWTTYFDEGPVFGKDGFLKRGDFGFILGGSALIAENVYIGFRYQQSFISVAKGAVAEQGKFYNNAFSIRFGVLL